MLGICRFFVIREVVEVRELPMVTLVMVFTRKMVPPEPIILTAVPTRIMSVFSLKANTPIRRASRSPTAMATRRPISQLLLQKADSEPNSADIIMIPSRPILEIPPFSPITAASVANRIGVAIRIMEKKKSVVRILICVPPFLRPFQPFPPSRSGPPASGDNPTETAVLQRR